MAVLVIILILVFGTLLVSLLPALIFWIAWTWYGIGATYFSFLPEQFHSIPFWDSFFLLMAIGTVANMVNGTYAAALKTEKK